jgi:hypothetical protein
MNGQDMRINCRNCSDTTILKPAGYYNDGSQRLLCSCCEKDGGVLHRCQQTPWSPPSWLPLLLAGIKIVCPECRAAYDLGVKIEPELPQVGGFLQGAGLFVGSIILIGVIADIFGGKKRRR